MFAAAKNEKKKPEAGKTPKKGQSKKRGKPSSVCTCDENEREMFAASSDDETKKKKTAPTAEQRQAQLEKLKADLAKEREEVAKAKKEAEKMQRRSEEAKKQLEADEESLARAKKALQKAKQETEEQEKLHHTASCASFAANEKAGENGRELRVLLEDMLPIQKAAEAELERLAQVKKTRNLRLDKTQGESDGSE